MFVHIRRFYACHFPVTARHFRVTALQYLFFRFAFFCGYFAVLNRTTHTDVKFVVQVIEIHVSQNSRIVRLLHTMHAMMHYRTYRDRCKYGVSECRIITCRLN